MLFILALVKTQQPLQACIFLSWFHREGSPKLFCIHLAVFTCRPLSILIHSESNVCLAVTWWCLHGQLKPLWNQMSGGEIIFILSAATFSIWPKSYWRVNGCLQSVSAATGQQNKLKFQVCLDAHGALHTNMLHTYIKAFPLWIPLIMFKYTYNGNNIVLLLKY